MSFAILHGWTAAVAAAAEAEIAAASAAASPLISTEIIVAGVAVLVSFFSLLTTIAFALRQGRSSAIASSFALMAQAEAMLKDVPSALKFHGVSDEDLRRAGITPEEFVYLIVNFTGAGVLYRMSEPDSTAPFQKGSYRYVMLSQPATQRAWPLLRKLINPEIGSYGKRIEATLKLIESDAANATADQNTPSPETSHPVQPPKGAA